MEEKVIKLFQYVCVIILFFCTIITISNLLNSNDIFTFSSMIITLIILDGAYRLIADEEKKAAEEMLHYYFKRYKLGIYSDGDGNNEEKAEYK